MVYLLTHIDLYCMGNFVGKYTQIPIDPPRDRKDRKGAAMTTSKIERGIQHLQYTICPP